MRIVKTPTSGQEPAQRLYAVDDAAAQLGVGRDYVYDRIKTGELRSVELGTEKRSKLRVRADDLQRFIDGRTHGRQTNLRAVTA